MKLLRIEYKKIVGNKSFKIFSLMFLVFLPLLAILIPSLVGSEQFNIYPLVPTNYETSWYAISFISSWFCFFLLSFVLIYHITNEYTYRTVRQNVIDGFTRGDYLKGKIYLMLAILVIATVYVFIVGLIGGLYFSSFEPKDPNMIQKFMGGENIEVIQTGDFGSITDGIENLFRFFIQSLGNFCFAFFIAFLTRRGILVILVYYAAYLAELFAGAMLSSRGVSFIYDYMPLNSFSAVLPKPSFISILQGITSPQSIDWLYIGISLVFSAIFILLAKYLFFKRDIS